MFVRDKSILFKTFHVLDYAVRHYDATFVLKTDDDAFINVGPMLQQLRALCEHPGCVRERLYMGKMAKHSEVLLQPGHKWNNAVFHNHTGACVRCVCVLVCLVGWGRGVGDALEGSGSLL